MASLCTVWSQACDKYPVYYKTIELTCCSEATGYKNPKFKTGYSLIVYYKGVHVCMCHFLLVVPPLQFLICKKHTKKSIPKKPSK